MNNNKFIKLHFLLIIFALLLFTGCSSINPQSGATFSGSLTLDKAGENATAEGGEVEFVISDDGKAITSMSYSLFNDKCKYENLTVNGVGTTEVRTPPPSIKGGSFTWDSSDAVINGSFSSSTEANGSITISVQHSVQMSLSSPQKTQIDCDYGTWIWKASVK